MKKLMTKGLLLSLSAVLLGQSSFASEFSLKECLPSTIKLESENAKIAEDSLKDVNKGLATSIKFLTRSVQTKNKKLRCDLLSDAKETLSVVKGDIDLIKYKTKSLNRFDQCSGINQRRFPNEYRACLRADIVGSSADEVFSNKRVSQALDYLKTTTRNNCNSFNDWKLKKIAKGVKSFVETLSNSHSSKWSSLRLKVKNKVATHKYKVKTCQKIVASYENKPTDYCRPDSVENGGGTDILDVITAEARKPWFGKPDTDYGYTPQRNRNTNRSIGK